jgi:hypothetical protein
MKKASCPSVILLFGGIVCLLFVVQIAQGDYLFGEVTDMGPLVNSNVSDFAPQISSDGLSLVFSSSRPPGNAFAFNYDIWMTTRATKQEDWLPATRLGDAVNSSVMDVTPWLSGDGLTLYYAKGAWPNMDIVVSRRTTPSEPWEASENLGSVVNSPAKEEDPSLTSDGLELYFYSNRSGENKIYVSTRDSVSASWREPKVLDIGNGGGPSISPDGLFLLFASERPGPDISADSIWMTRRLTRQSKWKDPVLLALPGYADSEDFSPYFGDGLLYFGSGRSGFWWNIFQVEITPVVDFNGDAIVDALDILELVGGWEATDIPLYDIAPSPFGDGIVDAKDLRALADYMIENAEVPLPSIDARSIVATASSSDSENTGPEKTIDGSGLNEHGQHSTVGTDMWLSGGTEPQWIQYEFDTVYELQEMHVWNSNQLIEPFLGLGAKDVLIETSVDGVEWTTVEGATQFNQATGSADYRANTIVDFGGIPAGVVRINIYSGYGTFTQWGLSEVRFF